MKPLKMLRDVRTGGSVNAAMLQSADDDGCNGHFGSGFAEMPQDCAAPTMINAVPEPKVN
jgi:hypothetical protein